MDGDEKAVVAVGCFAALMYLAIVGVVLWAIIALVAHYT